MSDVGPVKILVHRSQESAGPGSTRLLTCEELNQLSVGKPSDVFPRSGKSEV